MSSSMSERPPTEPAVDGLLVHQIVRAVNLHHRTAKYVLQRADALNIRPSTGRGEHRRFTLEESVRLALCTRLVMVGIPLARAIETTQWCEKTAKGFNRTEKDVPYSTDLRDPWVIRILDGDYVNLCRKRDFRRRDAWEFFEIGKWKEAIRMDPLLGPVVRIEWSITDLAWALARTI